MGAKLLSMIKPHQLLIQFITPLVWKASPQRKANAIMEFGVIERDSGMQVLNAIPLVKDPKTQSILFQHSLEEFHHGDLFMNLSDKISKNHLIIPVQQRDALKYDPNDPLGDLKFFSFVHVGEKAVNEDFAYYEKIKDDPELCEVFGKTRSDEARHQEYSIRLLHKMAGPQTGALRRILFKSEFLLWYRGQLGIGRKVADLLFSVTLTAIYFLIGPLVARSLKKRQAFTPDEQLKILRQELALFRKPS